MRLSPWAVLARPRGLSMVTATAFVLAGCSSGGSFGGPSWNLTGGKGAAPMPPRPIYASPSQPAALPPGERTVPIYRGGRDPVSGRAPTWGAPPQAMNPHAGGAASAAPIPYHVPSAVPTSPSPIGGATARGTGTPLPRTVEVRPGQSLASIAAEYRLSISALMQANALRDAYVIPGQRLVIPAR